MHFRSSVTSVVLTFNASLSACAPSFLMLFPIFVFDVESIALFDAHFFLSCTLPRYSTVSVVLTFNASLSARAPSSLIMLPACRFEYLIHFGLT